jgi:proteic killer suppression protein
MIENFRHKGLKRFYEEDDGRKLPADMLERIRSILTLLDGATSIEDMNRPSLKLHPLKGDFRGYWAVTVRANWRIIFQFEDGRARNVDFLDYH